MPPASPSPLTVRRDKPLVEEHDPRDAWPCPGEVSNWGMFGVLVRQEVIDGQVHTTVRPRTDGGTAALTSAVQQSPRHTLVTAATEAP